MEWLNSIDYVQKSILWIGIGAVSLGGIAGVGLILLNKRVDILRGIHAKPRRLSLEQRETLSNLLRAAGHHTVWIVVNDDYPEAIEFGGSLEGAVNDAGWNAKGGAYSKVYPEYKTPYGIVITPAPSEEGLEIAHILRDSFLKIGYKSTIEPLKTFRDEGVVTVYIRPKEYMIYVK